MKERFGHMCGPLCVRGLNANHIFIIGIGEPRLRPIQIVMGGEKHVGCS